jgi:hypothetical protein
MAVLAVGESGTNLSDAELLERGAEAFREGVRLRDAADQARPHFRKAAEHFEELHRRGANNALLYRNLGNAYLLADDPAHAILSYRRGLRVAPYDRDLERGLEQAREKVVFPSHSSLGRPPTDGRPPWLPRLRPGWVLVAAFAFYGLACAGLTRWIMLRNGWLLTLVGGGLVVSALLTAFVIVAERSERKGADQKLVVIAEDGVLVRKGDGLTYPPRYETPLNRGVEARLLFQRDDWLQIELTGGEVGWVPREYVLVDE